MRKSEWEGRCKRHQEHKLSKGVCPYCLTERLSHISASSSSATNASSPTTTTTSSSPYYSDSNLSSMASPPHIELNNSIKLAQFIENVSTLNKSRSLAVAFREEKEEDKRKQKEEKDNNKNKKKKKKKGMLLFKLITGSEKKKMKKENGGMLRSRTMREKPSSTKWELF